MTVSPRPSITSPVATPGFHSILFADPDSEDDALELAGEDFLRDLQIDQLIDLVIQGEDRHDLRPLFLAPLTTVEGIRFRQEVLQDLENAGLRGHVEAFGRAMGEMHDQVDVAGKIHYQQQRRALFLDAAGTYCRAAETLGRALQDTSPPSPGFQGFRRELAQYLNSSAFRELKTDVGRLKADLALVEYCVSVSGAQVTVSRFNDQSDYTQEIEDHFRRFRQGDVKDYRRKWRSMLEMDHVEAAILDRVAQLFPGQFRALESFCATYSDFPAPLLTRFDREVRFYLRYVDFAARLQAGGLAFCYPGFSGSKALSAENTFDSVLATKLFHEQSPVVVNDVKLQGTERILVVSGPNQGGKTTYARTIGQLHYCARLGLTVPGSRATLLLPDVILTHFERGENTADLRGKLKDDLIRIKEVLDRATPESLVIMNETFTSTTLADAVELGSRVLRQMMDRDLVCICVTFVEELSRLGPSTVSMTSSVNPEDPIQRTFKIVRSPATGKAHALVLAEKYGLTTSQLRKRISP